jgi:6-phosphogluconate dehydrogenase
MLLVMAGKPVDDFIESLLPFLEKGDIIIDGGNSHFPDSNRRTRYLSEKGISFVGSGVSGGEEGARYGPSLMPGGNEAAWPHIKDIFQGIAAKSDGEACCDWVGDEGAGHYVKMVHNGIEYGDMQLICEVSSAFGLGSEGAPKLIYCIRPTTSSSVALVCPAKRSVMSSPSGTRVSLTPS